MIKGIEKTGIPTFGLHEDMSNKALETSLYNIRNWIIDNGSSYDNSEPMIFLPEEQMELVNRKWEDAFH
jgi:hypothetical protein